ncbi:MAG: flagellar biosynthesis protein FlhF, partial [Gammaproteobacteria bacterium]|nr:flagellar biosynthesis protein FlhF [Gammaproteobacteria bacterium]
MKVKRFVAEDMRTALKQVKEDMGANAVILSNRKIGNQTEILVADSYDESFINQALDDTLNSQQNSVASAATGGATAGYNALSRTEGNRFNVAPERRIPQAQVKNSPVPPSASAKPGVSSASKKHPADNLFQSSIINSDLSAMHDELKTLKTMIESQQLMNDWGQLLRKHPLRVTLYKRLTELGLSQDVCKYLVKGLDETQDTEHALQAALKKMMHLITVIDDDILNRGGVYAMVGPTGVGKTTTIAKLAARFAMRHGQKHVALISTDNYRIGAHEQLMTYGRLLGVPVHSVGNAQELQQLLQKLHDKKLVLIDTAGMSQRDVRLSEQFVHVGSQQSLIKSYLVLSANA